MERGERLYPKRSSRVYWHLTCLRQSLEDFLRNHLPPDIGDVLLDFGCGNMPYRPLFENRISSYIGCDLPGNDIADQTIDDIYRLPFGDGSVDMVLSTQVLEHVREPLTYLHEARRVLKKDGYLLLSTHGVWSYHPDPFDFWRWTCEGLKTVITSAGYEVVAFRGIMGPAATAMQLWQDAVQPSFPYRLRSLFVRIMQFLIEKADRRCPQAKRDADACVYLVLARCKK